MTLNRNRVLLVALAGMMSLMLVCALSCVQNEMNTPQVIQLPTSEKLTLTVTAVPSDGKLGVGVRLMADDKEASGLSKDGKPVPVQVSVTDAKGNEVGSKTGPLSDFGFS